MEDITKESGGDIGKKNRKIRYLTIRTIRSQLPKSVPYSSHEVSSFFFVFDQHHELCKNGMEDYEHTLAL